MSPATPRSPTAFCSATAPLFNGNGTGLWGGAATPLNVFLFGTTALTAGSTGRRHYGGGQGCAGEDRAGQAQAELIGEGEHRLEVWH